MYIHLACLTYKQQFANIFCLCYFQINHIYVIISWLFFTYLCRVLICRKNLENKIPPIINWVVLPLPTGIYIYICASITHWLGSISKLPNQCENITKFSRHFQNCPINVRKLPNQCEMLAHPPCASISHWLGSFQKILGSFQVYQIYQNYPINVKCLHRGGAQAFHID